MGSQPNEKDRILDEEPTRQVRITKPFYLGKYEVMQDQYKAVMGQNPSEFVGGNQPVEMVSWDNAVAFCKKLSAKLGRNVRLPTEAEWEYACRAGTQTRFYWSDDPNYSSVGDYAWYDKNSGRQTHGVGQKKPNAWGLYDMAGNVWEWCSDRYADSYAALSSVDPQGPSSGKTRILRGGGRRDELQYCRSALRSGGTPDRWGNSCGFRIALDLN